MCVAAKSVFLVQLCSLEHKYVNFYFPLLLVGLVIMALKKLSIFMKETRCLDCVSFRLQLSGFKLITEILGMWTCPLSLLPFACMYRNFLGLEIINLVIPDCNLYSLLIHYSNPYCLQLRFIVSARFFFFFLSSSACISWHWFLKGVDRFKFSSSFEWWRFKY